MALFQSSVLKKYLAAQANQPIQEALAAYLTYFHNPRIRENIRAAKEEQFQEGFLRELFVKILGYTINPEPDFNLTTELKNIKDSKKTDGAILKDGNALAVIELKGTDTKDLDKIRDQAFNYKNNQPDCVYVITSNFEKLRFYIDNAVDYVEFNILGMDNEQFKLLWLLLQKDNLLQGFPKKIKEESLLAEEQITKQLYKDYSSFKQELWQDLVTQNPEQDELLLYKKSQKLLDRFLFIFFAEDKGLLPPNSIMEIVNQWKKLAELDEYRPIYERFKKYFGYLNTGRVQPGKAEIHAYNGGLFAIDPVLEELKISDSVLEKHVRKLTEYDFDTEVDTNILGHIFEHSLNDIENVRAQLAGETVDKSKTKRKRDGVFYTPKYITKYIVDNTLGRLCTEKKAELELVDEEFSKYLSYKTKEAERKRKTELKQKLDTYRNWLLQLTICDPACGSGAFLNQVLEFLIAEHRYVDELEAQLFDSPLILPNVENHILENNIFGVDINEESVEIARLSLWLRTAKKGRKLSSLNSNIKVGNSLIDDPEVAGDLAFNWEQEFPQVFAKGGFDVVVGNPPYVVYLKSTVGDKVLDFLFNKYKYAEYNPNTYALFTDLGKNCLLKKSGELGFIIPNSWLEGQYFSKMRNDVYGNGVKEIAYLKNSVFAEVVETVILFVKNIDESPEFILLTTDVIDEKKQLVNFEKSKFKNGYNPFVSREDPLTEKIYKSNLKFKDVAIVYRGLETRDNKIWLSEKRESDLYKPILLGRDVNRYFSEFSGTFVKFIKSEMKSNANEDFFQRPKILMRRTGSNIIATLDLSNSFALKNLYLIFPKSEASIYSILAQLNSKLFSFLHESKTGAENKAFAQFQGVYILDFPYKEFSFDLKPFIDQIILATVEKRKIIQSFISHLISKDFFKEPSTKLQNWPDLDFKGFLGELKKAKVHLSLSEEAEWMAYFTEQKAKALALQADIDRIDREIDALVYELYGLTEEEIRIVEGN
ncbi:Eco57I restriction-modification methylase domain-containing protein [Algoriphagus confluentis]|uniref:site-specific DNA-methyltransferase (adenine-specific) n=1 Tax=Algoriphagus confluentis TaxID=1697556 RepID=A0ABQ6PJX3_9BACT|nr:TaqI-like C-terminal specificity domain-containing protein [Algoriphagus confluentis]